MMKLGVGIKWGATAALALGAISTLYYVIQCIQEAERDRVIIEIQDRQIERRTQIDVTVSEFKSKTAQESLNYLESRNND